MYNSQINNCITGSQVYKIEGGIDFYKELFEPVIDQGSQPDVGCAFNEKEKCLLTNSDLDYGHIQLPCGHKFNFFSLYTETLYQKTNPAFVKNIYNTPIEKNKIKCPYCRSVHANSLLPYIVNNKRVNGVNSPVKFCSKSSVRCQHVSVSAIKKRETQCKTCINIHYIPALDGEATPAIFLCTRHVKLYETEKKTDQVKVNADEISK
jgi:hypothetical protein